MRKIVLVCSAGMSTSMLVKMMRKLANEENYECEITACPLNDASEKASNANAILLGPHVRFFLDKIKERCPGVPVDVIDMKMYGCMDSRGVLELAKRLMGE